MNYCIHYIIKSCQISEDRLQEIKKEIQKQDILPDLQEPGGEAGRLESPRFLLKLMMVKITNDQWPFDNNSETKKVAKKYKLLEILRKTTDNITLVHFT